MTPRGIAQELTAQVTLPLTRPVGERAGAVWWMSGSVHDNGLSRSSPEDHHAWSARSGRSRTHGRVVGGRGGCFITPLSAGGGQVTGQPATGRRLSLGGEVVELGLTRSGFSLPAASDVALVETERPRRGAFSVVLVQNAWNVVDVRTFVGLLRQYPPGKWPRVTLRRLMAWVNLRRAHRVVVLSSAMAALTRRLVPSTEVCPVTVPLDFLDGATPPQDPTWEGVALVPGTITWHKNTAQAAAVVSALRDRGCPVTKIVLAGKDDGSGMLARTMEAAARAGVPCEQRVLSREEMRQATASAEVVVLPSRLESLSLSMAEALLLGRFVVASRIPAHVEMAGRLDREPVWIGSGGVLAGACGLMPADQRAKWRAEWKNLGESLGLDRQDAR